MDLAVGSEIAGYRIEAVVGRGGMGVVYRAVQPRLDRTVALKLISPTYAQDPEFRERFERESRIAASIEHPNVVPVHEAGEHDGLLFISMRFVDGTDLRALLAREGGLEPVRAAALVSQVAAALDAAHARGLVHRDVKPANVLVAAADHAYLTDFGLSKHAASGAGLTATGQFVGTLDYIAPEQLAGGQVDARTDVYSLGCVLFQTLTGQVPFPRESDPAKLWAHMNEPPPRPGESAEDVPERFDVVVARALAKQPGDRYASAGDLGRAARAAAEGRKPSEPERVVAVGDAAPAAASTAAGTPTPTVVSRPPPHNRRPMALVAGVSALAAAAITAAVLALSGSDEDPPPAGPGVADSGAGALTTAEMQDRVEAFASLYTAEQPDEIGRLLAPGGTYNIAGGGSLDRDDVVAELRRQFDQLESPVLSLDGLAVDTQEQEGTVEGRYAIQADNAPPDVGTIRFQLVKIGDAVLIDGLEFVPR